MRPSPPLTRMHIIGILAGGHLIRLWDSAAVAWASMFLAAGLIAFIRLVTVCVSR